MSAIGASRRSSLANSGSSRAIRMASSRCGRSGWPCPVSCSRQAGCVKKAVVIHPLLLPARSVPALQLENDLTLPQQDLFISQAHNIQQRNTHARDPYHDGRRIVAEITELQPGGRFGTVVRKGTGGTAEGRD